MTQDNDPGQPTRQPEPEQQVPELLTELAVLLKLGNEFEETWQAANEVCDRHGIGRAA
jgi:hypothetical protein